MVKNTTYIQLNKIDYYTVPLNLSNFVLNLVINWKWFQQQTVGIQFVNAIDSISANIAEGFGRFNKKDKIKFYIYSQGSIKVAMDWNYKAFKRSLISEVEYKYILKRLQELPRLVNQLIQYTNQKLVK